MQPWHRIEPDHTFEIISNIGPVYRRIHMDRISLGDNITKSSNRLVSKGNTIHKGMPPSSTYMLEKRMMGSPTEVHDEQRKVKRTLHEIRRSLVSVTWPDERWRVPEGSIPRRRRALAGIVHTDFVEFNHYRWRMNMSITIVREIT